MIIRFRAWHWWIWEYREMKDKEKIVIFPQATGKTLRAKPRNQAERNFLRYVKEMETNKKIGYMAEAMLGEDLIKELTDTILKELTKEKD